jgi:ABC-type antimicrobial peptide transport system permease subunit
VPVVFLASIYTVIAAMAAMDDPRLGRIVLLFGIAIIAFFSFPPFWLSGS